MPKASTNRMIYNANYNKVGQCIYNKDLWNRPLLDFEWNRFHICQYFKKRSYMLYKTLLVLTVYSTTYFLQNCFLRFRKSGMQCWTFLNKYYLLELLRGFFCHIQQKPQKSKKRAHILFLTNVSSLFFDTKKEHLNYLETLNLYFF